MVHSVQCDRRSNGASLPICAKPRAVIGSTCGNDFGYFIFRQCFPYLVTGWVTAAGGAWNASIVAEYVTFKGQVIQASQGLGGQISRATSDEKFPLLAASVLVMAMVVVLFNRTVWRRLYDLAERRFSLSK